MDRDDYVSSVSKIITSNYPVDTDRGLKVAELGILIKRLLPHPTWEELGFPRLKDVVAVLEAEGSVRTGYDSKSAFTLWLPEGTERVERPKVEDGAPPPSVSAIFQPLRKPVWTAFIAALSGGKRFLRRTDGTVVMGVQQEPIPATNWIQIEPIDQDRQRSWAREFLREAAVRETEELLGSLASATWYRDFEDKLADLSPSHAHAWRRHRSNRVIQHVREWIARNRIPTDLVFEPRLGERTITSRRKPPQSQDLRLGLLAAVHELKTEQLLQLRIPAKILLSVFRPDLVSTRAVENQ